MNPLDRLLSLVRPGDSIHLEITGSDAGAQVLVAARLKSHLFDPEADSATNNLVRELTFPHLIRVESGQSVSDALDRALDSLAGAQAEGLAKLSDLDQAAARLREATAAAGKAKAPSKTAAKAGAKTVTVTDADADGTTEAEGASTSPLAPAPNEPAAEAKPSVFL